MQSPACGPWCPPPPGAWCGTASPGTLGLDKHVYPYCCCVGTGGAGDEWLGMPRCHSEGKGLPVDSEPASHQLSAPVSPRGWLLSVHRCFIPWQPLCHTARTWLPSTCWPPLSATTPPPTCPAPVGQTASPGERHPAFNPARLTRVGGGSAIRGV